MSEYTHYFAVRAAAPEPVRDTLRQAGMLSLVDRGRVMSATRRLAWQDIPPARRWVVVMADGSSADPWPTLVQLFDDVAELFVGEVAHKPWQLKLARAHQPLAVLGAGETAPPLTADATAAVARFFDVPEHILEEVLRAQDFLALCDAVDFPFEELSDDRIMRWSLMAEQLRAQGGSMLAEDFAD